MAISHATYFGNERPSQPAPYVDRAPRKTRVLTVEQQRLAESSRDRIQVRRGVVWTLSPVVISRFWSYVQVGQPGECWLWTGAKVPDGYGSFAVPRDLGVKTTERKQVRAHRMAFELVNGLIPDGLEPDHLCFARACCNPAHMEAVSGTINKQRSRRALRNTGHCRRGHPATPENLGRVRGGQHVYCQACRRDRVRARRTA